MSIAHVLYVLGGAAAAGIVGSLGGKGTIHKGAVKAASAGMRVTDAVVRVTQGIVGEASDINAEARRKARIDAAVSERLSELEEGIRAEVTAEVDGVEVEA